MTRPWLQKAFGWLTPLQVLLESVNGLVAVVYAPGTKLLSIELAKQFVGLRNKILNFTNDVVETKLPGLKTEQLKNFMLNDTVVVTYSPAVLNLQEVEKILPLAARLSGLRNCAHGVLSRCDGSRCVLRC